MTKQKTEKIGTIHLEDIKVRKKMPPATQVQKSPKDYDRKKMKQKLVRDLGDEG